MASSAHYIQGNISKFFQKTIFLVVGASTNKTKFGNKILRCYIAHQKNVIPINMKEESIESIPCVPNITQYVQLIKDNTTNTTNITNNNNIGISICTPPKITLSILKEGVSLGLTDYLCQPGTLDDACMQYINEIMLSTTTNSTTNTNNANTSNNTKYNIITGCVLQELQCIDILNEDEH